MEHQSSFVTDDILAAADFFGPGALETPMYESEITDLVRRRGVLGQRIQEVPATGHPSRYFEQSRIVSGAFTNPRNMGFNPTGDPTRRERAFNLKAIYAPISFGLFDVEVTRQQGQFSQLVAKDINDTIQGTLRTSDKALWMGTDTDLVDATTLEYVGALNQINRTATIASSASIVDGLKAEIAAIIADVDFDVRPTAVYLNPLLGDLIDQEERLNQRQMHEVEVVAGIRVNALSSQAGVIPLIPDHFLQNGPTGESTTEADKTDYRAVILTEPMVELHYLTSPRPRVFQLGLEGNLNTRYAIVMFGAPVFKGKANAAQDQTVVESGMTTYAHSVVTVVR